jgi:hypothetical protein
MFVAWGTQNAIRMRHMVMCDPSGSTKFFHIFSQRHDLKNVAEKMCKVLPPYPLIQYPRFQLYAVYRGPKKKF